MEWKRNECHRIPAFSKFRLKRIVISFISAGIYELKKNLKKKLLQEIIFPKIVPIFSRAALSVYICIASEL